MKILELIILTVIVNITLAVFIIPWVIRIENITISKAILSYFKNPVIIGINLSLLITILGLILIR